HVDGAQGLPQRGDWLHGGPHDDGLPGGDAALETARTVRPAGESGVAVEEDLVVNAGARSAGRLETQANPRLLDRMDGAERLGEKPVELPVPLHVRPEADGAAKRDHLEYAPERVTGRLGLVDRGDHGALSLERGAPHLGLLGAAANFVPWRI